MRRQKMYAFSCKFNHLRIFSDDLSNIVLDVVVNFKDSTLLGKNPLFNFFILYFFEYLRASYYRMGTHIFFDSFPLTFINKPCMSFPWFLRQYRRCVHYVLIRSFAIE